MIQRIKDTWQSLRADEFPAQLRYDLFRLMPLSVRHSGLRNSKVIFLRRGYRNAARDENRQSTFVITGDRDDRAVPSHAYNFAARLYKNQTGRAPILLKTYQGIGHGLDRLPEMIVDEYMLLWRALEMVEPR